MIEEEFKAQMEKIYAYNRKQNAERQEMARLRLNEQTIREALSSLGHLPTPSEALAAFAKIREVLNNGGKN